MTWIDDDYEELKRQRQAAAELSARESEIAGHADKIYEDLWTELVARIDEARTKRVAESSLLTNGSSYDRKVIAGKLNIQPSHYILKLAQNRQSITFTGPDTNIILPLDMGEDEVVRIRHDGECKTIRDVARSLLRPLIFPEMFGQK